MYGGYISFATAPFDLCGIFNERLFKTSEAHAFSDTIYTSIMPLCIVVPKEVANPSSKHKHNEHY